MIKISADFFGIVLHIFGNECIMITVLFVNEGESQMTEKRRAKRVDVNLQLKVSTLFKQDNVKISDVDSPIEVRDISKGGIGFVSKSILPVGYYFNAELQLGNEADLLYCVIKIIRNIKKDDGSYAYGAEFVGMAPVFDYIFEEYEEESEGKNQ